MKQVAPKHNSSYKYRFIKSLEILTVLSFICISYNDSKGDLPLLEWAIIAIFLGTPLWKINYLAILLSWIYLGALIFQNRLYKQMLVIVAIGILWVLVILQGYGMFTSAHPDDIDRNHWFIGSSTFFLISSSLLLFQVLNTKQLKKWN